MTVKKLATFKQQAVHLNYEIKSNYIQWLEKKNIKEADKLFS